MSHVLEELLQLFAFKKGNLLTANRKTLELFLRRTKFQERRRAFYEAKCSKGRKVSRVALCKKKKRPAFTEELSNVSTKRLREIIQEFLKELGIENTDKLRSKTTKQLEKLGRKHHWPNVLFLSAHGVQDAVEDEDTDDEKKKGSGRFDQYKIDPEKQKQLDEALDRAEAQAQLIEEQKQDANPPAQRRRRRRRRSSLEPAPRRRRGPKKGAKYRKRAKVITGRDDEGALQYE